MSYTVKYKHVQDPAEADDGARILVDPVFPKDKCGDSLGLDEWYSQAAPSIALRKSLRTANIEFAEFAENYRAELESNRSALTPLLKYARDQGLTLLSVSPEPERSHLPVLQRVIVDALQEEDDQSDLDDPSSPVCYDR